MKLPDYTLEYVAPESLLNEPLNLAMFEDGGEREDEFQSFVKSCGQIFAPLIANRRTMKVLHGNRRLRAAVNARFSRVPVAFFDRDLDDSEIELLLAALNVHRELTPREKYNITTTLAMYYQNHPDLTNGRPVDEAVAEETGQSRRSVQRAIRTQHALRQAEAEGRIDDKGRIDQAIGVGLATAEREVAKSQPKKRKSPRPRKASHLEELIKANKPLADQNILGEMVREIDGMQGGKANKNRCVDSLKAASEAWGKFLRSYKNLAGQ